MFFILILILFVCYISNAVSICKIYSEKTIEVGVYIDRHLYKNMEEVFPIDIHHTFGSVYHIIHLWKKMEEVFLIDIYHTFGSVCTSYHPPLQEHEGGIIYLLTVVLDTVCQLGDDEKLNSFSPGVPGTRGCQGGLPLLLLLHPVK